MARIKETDALNDQIKFMTKNIGTVLAGLEGVTGLMGGGYENRLYAECAAGNAIKEILPSAGQILLAYLDFALSVNPEFGNYAPLAMHIRNCFKSAMRSRLLITFGLNGGVEIYKNAQSFIGDTNDLQEGFYQAKSELGLGGAIDPLKVWTYKIYKPAREGEVSGIALSSGKRTGASSSATGGEKWRGYKGNSRKARDVISYANWAYSRTIDARLASWNQKAPYWLLLEHGSGGINLGGNPFYPPIQGTNFVTTSERAINLLYAEALLRQVDVYQNVISEELRAYLQNPWNEEAFPTGKVLAQFGSYGKGFAAYIKKSGNIGIKRLKY